VAGAVALALLARRMSLTWLAAPGLVVAAVFLFSPRWNGGAFVLGLGASLLGAAGLAIAAVAALWRARRLATVDPQ
jgi:hypothetical protein